MKAEMKMLTWCLLVKYHTKTQIICESLDLYNFIHTKLGTTWTEYINFYFTAMTATWQHPVQGSTVYVMTVWIDSHDL